MPVYFTPNNKTTQPALAGFYRVKRHHPSNEVVEWSYYDGQFFHQPMPNIGQAHEFRRGMICPDVVSWASIPTA